MDFDLSEIFWSVSVTPDQPFSPPKIEGIRLRLTQMSLSVLDKEEQVVAEKQEAEEQKKKKKGVTAPMPKHIEEFVKAKEEFKMNILNLKHTTKPNGCCVQACIYDEEINKRRKFVLGTLSTGAMQVEKLNHFFDEDQISNLTFECKGRPHLNKKHCTIHITGTVEAAADAEYDYDELVKRAKQLRVNEHRKKMDQIKKELEAKGEEKPWEKKDDPNYKKKEEEDEEDVMEDHSGPKEFISHGVQITNIFVGHGRKAQRGDRVTIAYKGKLDPNKNHAFDKTSLRNPYSFRIGSRKVIKGINIGVEGMTLHGKREIVIPSNKGFGSTGIPEKVPADATLYYDIELVGLVPRKKAEKEIVEANQELQSIENRRKKRQHKQLSSEFVHEEPAKKKKK